MFSFQGKAYSKGTTKTLEQTSWHHKAQEKRHQLYIPAKVQHILLTSVAKKWRELYVLLT